MRIVQSLLLLTLISGVGAQGSHAQGFPTKPVRIFTTAAGGANDRLVRIIGTEMSASLGQSILVENRPAGFALGSSVAQAEPDGHTLLAWSGTLWVQPLLEKAPYDPVRDFAPITTLTRAPNLLVVTPSVPAQTVAELIKLAKAHPGELAYSTGSTGGASHVGAELFKSMAGASILRVQSNGSAEEIAALMSGKAQMIFGTGTSMGPHIKAGKLRALATAGSGRSILFPDLPTVADTLPGFTSEQVVGLLATGKTPEAVIRRLNQETVRVLDKADVREKLLKLGQEPAGGSPEQLAQAIKTEMDRVAKIIKETGLKPGA